MPTRVPVPVDVLMEAPEEVLVETPEEVLVEAPEVVLVLLVGIEDGGGVIQKRSSDQGSSGTCWKSFPVRL